VGVVTIFASSITRIHFAATSAKEEVIVAVSSGCGGEDGFDFVFLVDFVVGAVVVVVEEGDGEGEEVLCSAPTALAASISQSTAESGVVIFLCFSALKIIQISLKKFKFLPF
jgi:hypothetical protein